MNIKKIHSEMMKNDTLGFNDESNKENRNYSSLIFIAIQNIKYLLPLYFQGIILRITC